jgi:lipopolysaccharide transport system ATP-binding protein
MEPAIRAVNLGKRYRLGGRRARYKALRDVISDAIAAPFRRARLRSAGVPAARVSAEEHIWALRDVSFEVTPGEAVGFIGRNGAGKSTLLKVLSRITEPTAGDVYINGRVGSLLEVGTGFHPELTGGENIFLNGAILGMRQHEIKRQFDAIVAFAEVEKFIDTPVKHYSSGMHLRLAFAVAAHLDTEVIIVDEVLAVGDAVFQRKCLGKMQEVGQTGRTVLFVSHDMTAISRLTNRCMVLDGGQITYSGPTTDAIQVYLSQQVANIEDLASRRDRSGDGLIRLDSIGFFGRDGRRLTSVQSGQAVSIAVGLVTKLPAVDVDDLALHIRFRDVLGHPAATLSTKFGSVRDRSGIGGAGTLICHVPSLTLAEGTYFIDLLLFYRKGRADAVTQATELSVATANYFGTGYLPVGRKHGPALIRHSWTTCGECDDDVSAEVALSHAHERQAAAASLSTA